MAIKSSVTKLENGHFSVHIKDKELVTAESSLPESWLPLSNLDLLIPPLDSSIFFVYQNPVNIDYDFGSVASILKKALSKLLIPYYPLAGEMVINPAGEPELHCNNRGVDFVEAYADIELHKLDLHNPDASVEGKLLPCKMRGIVYLQVTNLKCGGVVVSCTSDHRIADAYSINMFLETWAEMARTNTITMTPSFQRSLLSPRRPGSYNESVDELYIVLPPLPPSTAPDKPLDHLISRIYYMRANDVNNLQALASDHGSKRSKLEAFSGCLWKVVAKSASEGKTCKLGIVVDGRLRLIDDERSTDTMAKYFGNVISVPYGEIDAKELTKRPLSWVADQVHEFIGISTTKDHFLGLIDMVEAHRPHPAISKIYYRGSLDGPSFVVSHGRLFQFKKLDFGWGRPVFGSCHFPWGGGTGYVMPMSGPSENGDWVIYMHLFKHQLDMVEAELGDILNPLSVDHLNLNAN